MPKDFTTYMWLLYKRVIVDESPERLAFLQRRDLDALPDYGKQLMVR